MDCRTTSHHYDPRLKFDPYAARIGIMPTNIHTTTKTDNNTETKDIEIKDGELYLKKEHYNHIRYLIIDHTMGILKKCLIKKQHQQQVLSITRG